jgi:hypothetical protein
MKGSQGPVVRCRRAYLVIQGAIDSLFDRLEKGEEEFDDLIIGEVDVDIIEHTRWLAVARVNCGNGFSNDAFL